MANKSLNDKYGIPFLSEWEHKDGGTYMALKIEHSFKSTVNLPVVFYMKILNEAEKEKWHKEKIVNGFVRTVEHFKRSFKEVKK